MVMKLPPEVSFFFWFDNTKLHITKRAKVAESTIVVAKNIVMLRGVKRSDVG
jgi:hypothetical protein